MNGARSLFSRFAASTAVLAAAIVVLAFFSYHAIRGDIFRDSFETPLGEWSAFLAGHIGADPALAQAAARSHEMGVVLMTKDATYAFGPDGRETTAAHLAEHFPHARTILVQGHGDMQYSFYLNEESATVVSSIRLWALIGGLLFLLGVVYVVQLSQLRPLRWLKDGVDKVSEGDLSARVPVVRMDEIGQVGRAFNRMTERVEQMLNDHDRLMADVSHELRSPLARIKVALEMLPEGEKREQIARDVRQMEGLTSALLERERIKSRTATPTLDDVDLVATVKSVISGFDGRAPGIELVESPDSLIVAGDEALLTVLLQNVIDNALKFSLEDSASVQVRLRSDTDSVSIIIDDDGKGIPADMSKRVLEPFVKLDPSRGHGRGYGLGLNLSLRVAKAHGGDIEIEAREPRGSRVVITLPTDVAGITTSA
ncbi:MAG: HAMP domain-containing sensor histidine kinase [Woeseiaceae bacterium]